MIYILHVSLSMFVQGPCKECKKTTSVHRGNVFWCKECKRIYNAQHTSSNKHSLALQHLSTLEQIGTNAVSLVNSLPTHSHHRAPLVHHLTQGITSTQASTVIKQSASYIRECKRKNVDESELLTEKYSNGAKRQKLGDSSINNIFNFIKDNCPVKSGSNQIRYRQYMNDEDLYKLYSQTAPLNIRVVCLKTFNIYKKQLNVRKVRSYWGQFDCSLCIQLRRLKPAWMQITDVERLNRIRLTLRKGQLRKLLYHRIQYFHSAINTF